MYCARAIVSAGAAMQARVAATLLRGEEIWNGSEVKAKPGTGRFVPRQHRRSALDAAG